MEPVAGLPDLVFTANAGLIFGDRFLSSRFRFGVRQGETPHFDAWFAANGFRVETLPASMYFEGAGDALFCGETLLAGYRFRSDARSHLWIGEQLGVPVLPLELVDPRYYHLDTCFCPLAADAAIYFPGAFDDYGRSVLRSRIPTLIEVSAEEAVSFSCNAVVVGRSVALNVGAPKLARSLRRCRLCGPPAGTHRVHQGRRQRQVPDLPDRRRGGRRPGSIRAAGAEAGVGLTRRKVRDDLLRDLQQGRWISGRTRDYPDDHPPTAPRQFGLGRNLIRPPAGYP